MSEIDSSKSISDSFSEAISLRDTNQLDSARKKLLNIIRVYPKHNELFKVYAILASVQSQQNLHRAALKYYKKSLLLKPEFELASLGIYISYVELGKHKKAICELDQFLSKYPIDLYKTTLEELIDGLRNGFARDFESIILRQARRHGVPVIT